MFIGQRPGAFAVYLEPWHFDVFDFLELKKNTGKEEQRARDLFFALWIPDLFMKRVESNQVNTVEKSTALFCLVWWLEASPKYLWSSPAVIGLVSNVSLWLSWVRRMLGRGVWGALHSVHPALQCLLLEMVHFSSLTCQMSLGCPQIRERGQGEACGEGPAAVARHHWVPNRNRHTIHALQGCLQQEEQPAESGHHQIQQSVHRDSRIHKQRWGVAHFYNINITLNDILVLFFFSAHFQFYMFFLPIRLQCVTWHPLLSTCMSPQTRPMTLTNWHQSPKLLSRTWTRSLTSTTTQSQRFVLFFSVEHLLYMTPELVCVTLQVAHLLLCRLKGQTCDTGQLELGCRVWLMPSSSCAIHLKAQRPSCSTFRSLRPSTTLPWRPAVSWLQSLGLMKPMLALLSARGWVMHRIHLILNSLSVWTHHYFVFQILQYDMWGKTPTELWDWKALKEKIAK